MFTAPIWFWLSAAAVVPVLVHLWNRKSGKPLLLGTFRFLPKESSAKASRLELHEIPLLFVRIFIVMTIVLLLAGLFWNRSTEAYETVTIVETEGAEGFQIRNRNGNNPEIEISSEYINLHGWWNIISRIDGEFRPELIIINGEMSDTRFGLNRKPVFAEVLWNEPDTANRVIYSSWTGSNGLYSAFTDERDGAGVRSRIETAADFENAELIESPLILLHEEASSAITEGVRFTAERWNIPVQTRPQEELIIFEKGDERRSLNFIKAESGVSDFLETNPVSSMQVELSNIDTTVSAGNILLRSSVQRLPVLVETAEGNFVLNGEAADYQESWFFAGITQKILKEILGVEHRFSPVLSEQQRVAAGMYSTERAPGKEPVSAKYWMISLLILLWTAERFMAPAGEM